MDEASRGSLNALLATIEEIRKAYPAEVKKELWKAWLRAEPLPRCLTDPLTAAPEQQPVVVQNDVICAGGPEVESMKEETRSSIGDVMQVPPEMTPGPLGPVIDQCRDIVQKTKRALLRQQILQVVRVRDEQQPAPAKTPPVGMEWVKPEQRDSEVHRALCSPSELAELIRVGHEAVAQPMRDPLEVRRGGTRVLSVWVEGELLPPESLLMQKGEPEPSTCIHGVSIQCGDRSACSQCKPPTTASALEKKRGVGNASLGPVAPAARVDSVTCPSCRASVPLMPMGVAGVDITASTPTTPAAMLDEVHASLMRTRDALEELGHPAIAAKVEAVRQEVLGYAQRKAQELENSRV